MSNDKEQHLASVKVANVADTEKSTTITVVELNGQPMELRSGGNSQAQITFGRYVEFFEPGQEWELRLVLKSPRGTSEGK